MNETFLCRSTPHSRKKEKIYKILFHENDGISCPVQHSAQSLPQSHCFKFGTINVRNLYEKTGLNWRKNKKQKGSYYHSVSVRPRPCRRPPAGVTTRTTSRAELSFTSALRIFSKPEEWKREKRERRRSRARLAIEREIARALAKQ